MKLITQILAWLHILPFAGVFLVVLFFLALGGGVLTGLLKPDNPQPGWETAIAGLGVMALGCFILGFALIFLLPWVFLLKRRNWAWWILTAFYALQTALGLFVLALTYPDWLKTSSEAAEIPGIALVWVVTLLILLTDRPPWHHKRRKRKRSEG